ncbi:MAG: ATP-binding protein [Chloroflexota bacterium]|nr:ATP-binding protein [Chloroflexota bacterium]
MTTTRDLQEIYFTVDAELLRELGERLVGRQYIALAELVKNSYDADATKVEIRIEDDCIKVSDNGHGMTHDDFANRWMRVGSTHKVAEMRSPEFNRPLTGSKGVGRLAVQFLARDLELISTPDQKRIKTDSSPRELFAIVDWDSAVQAGDLTRATALYEEREPKDTNFPLGTPHGTTVTLNKLKHEWSPEEFEDLAKEVWFLQPPFRALSGFAEGQDRGNFEVELHSIDPTVEAAFKEQMPRMLDLHNSRLVGRLLPDSGSGANSHKRKVMLSLELEGDTPRPYEFRLPVRGDNKCLIDRLEFEIRIFTLRGRQRYGIQVQQAREYMAEWGGVHIYDAGFRVPYAGPDADWLRLEFDHSHRLTQSRLLPNDLNVRMGLNFLPTNSRVLGVVNIDTSREAEMARRNNIPPSQSLQIQVSRDRLVSNEAFRQLRDAVRFALDYYSTRMAVLRLEEKEAKRGVETPESLVENVWDVLDRHEVEIPKPVMAEIRNELAKSIDSVREQSEWTRNQAGLLGAMATVGATALAFDHQLNQQLGVLEHHATTLVEVIEANPELKQSVGVVSANITRWIKDVRDTRVVFSPISDERNRTAVARFRAKPLIQTLSGNLRTILRDVDVDVSLVDKSLLLPETSYPAWMAIFHNLFTNAANAMLDSDRKRILVSSFKSGRRLGIRLQDTGVGIDLGKAEGYFQPLARGLEITPERQGLIYGGTGLGLAIVRMLATDLNADVRFVKPTPPFSTCFEMSWSEKS